jgi:hypothetical protein
LKKGPGVLLWPEGVVAGWGADGVALLTDVALTIISSNYSFVNLPGGLCQVTGEIPFVNLPGVLCQLTGGPLSTYRVNLSLQA